MSFKFFLLCILFCSCALKNDSKNNEINCAHTFEHFLASFINQPKVQAFGTYQSETEKELRGMPLECGVQIKRLKNHDSLYSIFIGRDTRPPGNPRKILDDEFILKSCESKQFEMQSIDRKDTVIQINIVEKNLTLNGNSRRLDFFTCKNIPL